METIYFLIFIGVCAFAVVWATRRSKTGSRRKPTRNKIASEKLFTPVDNRLAHKNQLWEARREQANKGVNSGKMFVPKFEAAQEAQYDGYSRRDRHHLTATERVRREETHTDRHGNLSITRARFNPKEHASQT